MEIQLFPSARNLGQHGLSSTSDQPGFSRRYACDRCRGHKLRCNRDAMSSMTTPCRRCSKATAKCTISSNFRPGRPSDDGDTVVGQERAMRAQGRTPTAETRKSQSSTGSLALAQEEIAQYSENGGMLCTSASFILITYFSSYCSSPAGTTHIQIMPKPIPLDPFAST